MLKLTHTLIGDLNASGMAYCHWKSNVRLAASLDGRTDIDLLIRPRDACAFRSILNQLHFRPAQMDDVQPLPSMEHYYALDEESGVLVHVHAYTAVITGESLAKNYRFPLDEMLFCNKRKQDGVWVPVKGAELVLFTIRMMLKHTSVVELLLLARDWREVKQEAMWLTEGRSIDQALCLLNEWLPSVDSSLFLKCVTALRKSYPVLYRLPLAMQLRSQLRMYARHSAVQSSLTGLRELATMFVRRVAGSKKGMRLQSGGAVVAFVGPEATGKSTLLAEVRGWLGEHFVVEQVHAGKPKPTLLSVVPSLLVPALRALLPTYRSGHVETQYAAKISSGEPPITYPLIFGIRSVLLAYDRRALLTKASARAMNGAIVLCDRYPSTASGTTDSPQLSQFNIRRERSPLRYLLAQIEKRLYQQIPAPDLVVSLTVPLEVALVRNKTRGKEEPENFVRRRHAKSSELVFEGTRVFSVNTDQPLDQTVSALKKAIWQAI